MITARLEHAAGCGVEGGRVVEGGLLGEENVLGNQVPLEALKIASQGLFPIGELPVPRHCFDTEEIGCFDHVLALQCVGEPAALPKVSAVEQNRIAGARFSAQAVDQSLEKSKSAHAAVAVRRLLVIEEGKCVRAAAARFDAEMIKKCAAHQVRRLPTHRADADVDVSARGSRPAATARGCR